jgi:hypothetical protein
MSIAGVNNNPLELFFSNDKNIQDFMSGVNTGDTIRGRVVDIIQGENKAIINFKGYNVISQLPQGSELKPGDIINAQVLQVNNQIFMKLIPDGMAAELGRGIDLAAQQSVNPQQLIVVLNDIKVPVNEQNIFIAQKLIDYHLPVTAQNINDINSALKSYFNTKGFDIRTTNIQNQQTAKLIVLSNIFKLNSEAAALLEKLNSAATADNARTNAASQQEIIQAPPPQASIINAADYNIIAVRLANISETAGSVASASPDINITSSDNSVSVFIKNAEAELLRNIAVSALSEGTMTADDVQAVINILNNSAGSASLSGGVTLNKLSSGDAEISFNSLKQAVEQIAASAVNQPGGSAASPSQLNGEIIQNLMTPAANSPRLSFVSARPDIINVLPQDNRQANAGMLAQARNAFASLQKNAVNPGDINLQQSLSEITAAIGELSSSLAVLKTANGNFAGNTEAGQTQAQAAVNDISLMQANLGVLMKQIGMTPQMETFNLPPTGYGALRSAVLNFVNQSTASFVLNNQHVLNIDAPISIKVTPMINVESTLESLSFMKSRNLPLDNSTIIDTMSKYFNDDMKLNQNMQGLSNAIDRFNTVKSSVPVNQSTGAFINNVSRMSANIKSMMQQISVNTDDAQLKGGIVLKQVENFIDKSGLNQENGLLKASMQQSARPDVDLLPQMIAARDNLKAELIRLNNEITTEKTQMLSDPSQKETVQVMKDRAGDVLTNLSAIQFLNQKPVSYDMIYTQIPVLINSNFFNSELQVWYRKGSLKDNFERSLPVNLVFMLNTSNIGSVKISMTIFKKDVECNVTLENEKAKQVLNRGKNDFIKGLGSMNFNVKSFNLMLSSDKGVQSPGASEGYVNLGRINLEA